MQDIKNNVLGVMYRLVCARNMSAEIQVSNKIRIIACFRYLGQQVTGLHRGEVCFEKSLELLKYRNAVQGVVFVNIYKSVHNGIISIVHQPVDKVAEDEVARIESWVNTLNARL